MPPADLWKHLGAVLVQRMRISAFPNRLGFVTIVGGQGKETLTQAINQESEDSVRAAGARIAALVQAVLDQCCQRSGRFGEHHAQSGMVWFDTPARVNAIVGYASTFPMPLLILLADAIAALGRNLFSNCFVFVDCNDPAAFLPSEVRIPALQPLFLGTANADH